MRRSSGFTLIELLVAIMILTLFMTAAMGAVRIHPDGTEEGLGIARFEFAKGVARPGLEIRLGGPRRPGRCTGEKQQGDGNDR